MNDKDITRVSKKANTSFKGKTDWVFVNNLSDEEIQKRALDDTDAQPMSSKALNNMSRMIDIKAIRFKLGMSQRVFAKTFHLSFRTLQDWEQKRCQLDSASYAYLTVIKHNPQAIIDALNVESN